MKKNQYSRQQIVSILREYDEGRWNSASVWTTERQSRYLFRGSWSGFSTDENAASFLSEMS